jgi:fibronectin type 3 domain-containing protein
MRILGRIPSKSKGIATQVARSGLPLVLTVLAGCVSENAPTADTNPPVVLESLSVVSYDATSANVLLRGKVHTPEITSLTSIRFHLSATCADAAIGTGIESTFESPGIPVVVPSGASSPIYLSTNTSNACYVVITYDPTHTAPGAPTFTSISPASPSRTSTTPILFGTVTPTTTQVRFFDDIACTHSVGIGPAGSLGTTGIQVSLTAETTNTVYVQAAEPFGNTSACALFTTYIHSTAGPNPPVYGAINPPSPTHLTSSPLISGLLGVGATSVQIYKDPACLTSIATGTTAEFTGAGVMVTVDDNSSTALYAVAYDASARPSSCAYLTTYVYDIIAPAPPTFVSLSPLSPTKATIYPAVKGLASADTAMVKLFNNPTCSTLIGTGTKALFEGAGLTASARSNDLTTIYAVDIDMAGNASSCAYLADFVNDTIPPDPPVYSTTVPISPNNQSITPLILGNAPIDAVSVSFYNDDQCTNQIGAGTSAAFTNPGVTVTVVGNTTTSIYGAAFDSVGNKSTCALMLNYMHSTAPAPVPIFVQTLPVSPSHITVNPWVRGTVSNTITTVKLFDDMACAHQIASGSRPTFLTSGIQIVVPTNSQTAIYSIDIDIYGNQSPCVYFVDYIHENRAPLDPTFTNTAPISPNNASTNPTIIGTALPNPASRLTPNVVSIYDSPVCTNRLGTGSPTTYGTTGIAMNVPANTTTSLYGRSFDAAGNISNCTYLADYTHDSLKPGRPLFTSATPASPSYSQNTAILGTRAASPDFLATSVVTLYSDPSCTTVLATGSPALFGSAGIPIVAAANATTTLYGDAVNIVGTHSTCAFLTNFLHEDVGPSNLIANLNPNGSVAVSWNPDMIANPSPTYKLSRSVRSGGPYTIVANPVFGTGFTDRSVTSGATYYYVVSASNNTGASKNSTEASVTVTIGSSASPASLTATTGADLISLNWSGFSSSLFYKVFRGTTPGGPYTEIVSNLAVTSYVDLAVTPDVPYFYVVLGSNPAGESVTSNEASGVAKDIPPAPTGLSITPVTSLAACGGLPGVMLQWTPATFAQQYVVRASAVSSATKSVRTTVAGTSFIDCSPTSGTSGNFNGIYYDVQAKFGGQLSAGSNEANFHAVTITALSATPGNGAVTLDWTNTGGAASYKVYRSNAQGGPYTLLTSGVPFNQYIDNAVVNGTAYFYTVSTMFADGGEGFQSAEAGAIPGPNPSAPSGLNLTVFANQPVLDWIPPDHYSSFTIYSALSAGGPYAIEGTSLTPNFTDGAVQVGRNYYYVTANWGGFESAATNVVSFRNGIPATLTLTPTATTVGLSWASVPGASSYKVKRAISSQGPYGVIAAANATTTYTDSAVTANTGYYYVVSANFADGTFGQNSVEKSAMPGASKVPSDLTVLSTSSGSVTIGWAAITGAATYRVYQSKNILAGPYTQVATGITNPTRTLTSLLPQTTYYFKVTSVTSNVESAQSVAVGSWTASPPGAPTVSAGNNSVDLQWSPLPTSPTFDVQRSTDGTSFVTIASGISSTTYTDAGVVNGTLYFYRLIATYTGATLTSTISPAVVPGITPLPPTGLTAVANITGTDLTLGWAPVGGATGYNLYMAGTSGGPYGAPVVNTSATNSILISGLTPGTTYYFVVSALIGTMESSISAEISAIPNVQPAAPLTTTAALSVSVAWTAVPGATTYDVERSSSGGGFISMTTGLAATSYVDNSVLFGYPYVYRYRPHFAGNPFSVVSLPSIPVTPGSQPEAPLGLHAEAPNNSSVNLSWITTLNIISYRIYRGTASGGPYTLLTTLGPAATTYTDGTVVAGTTYYYVIVSVNASAVESPYSNEQGVRLVNAPTGLTAVNAPNVINLSWTAAPGATGYVVRRGTQTGGAYGLLAANNATTTFTDSNIENGFAYYYVVDAIFAGGSVSNHSNEATATGILNLNLQLPIELTDRALASDVAQQAFFSTQTTIDTTAYDGVVTYDFELVVTNTDTVSRTVELVDNGGTPIASLAVPSGTSNPSRLRASFTPTAGSNVYRVRLPATPSAGLVQVSSARAWVTQIGATKTKLYIPLLASGAAPTSVDTDPISTSAFLGYTDLTEATLFKRDTSVYTSLSDYNPWELETVVAVTGAAVGSVTLYDASLGAVVTDTETVFSSLSPTLVNSPFDEGVTNFGTPNELENFQVSVACQTGCSGGAATIYKAGLWVSLTGMAHLQIVERIGLGGMLPTTPIESERTLLDLTKFSNPIVYFQAVANPPNLGSASIDLMDAGATESGTGGLSSVAGSTLNFNAYSKTLIRTGALTIPTGKRLLPKVTSTGGNTAVSDTSIIIDVTR